MQGEELPRSGMQIHDYSMIYHTGYMKGSQQFPQIVVTASLLNEDKVIIKDELFFIDIEFTGGILLSQKYCALQDKSRFNLFTTGSTLPAKTYKLLPEFKNNVYLSIVVKSNDEQVTGKLKQQIPSNKISVSDHSNVNILGLYSLESLVCKVNCEEKRIEFAKDIYENLKY